jgi:chromosome segregation ATPase
MLNADLDKYKIQLDDLTNERDDLKNKLNVYEIQTEEKSKIHKLESQKLEDEIKDLRKEREVHLEQLSLLEKERDSLLEKSLTLEQRITELTENQEALKNLPVQTGINAGSTEQPAIQPIELSQEPKGEDQAQTLSSQDGDGNQTQEMDEDRLGVQSEDIDKEIKKIKSKISDLENKLSTEKGKKKDTIQKQINEQKSKLDELTKEEHRISVIAKEHQAVKVTGADGEPAPEESAAKLDQTIEADKQELTKIQQELHDGHKLDHDLQAEITHLMMEKEKLTDNVALLANLIKTEIDEVEKG